MKGSRNEKNLPPKFWTKVVRMICPGDLIEGILGDLLEEHNCVQLQRGKRAANFKFIWNVLRLFHPYILLRNNWNVQMINRAMLKNHLKVATRSMLKNKFYALINVLGLSCVLAFVLLCAMFIRSELSYDQFHSNKDNIYRLYHRVVDADTGEELQLSAVTAIPLSRDMKRDIPSIRQFSRLGSYSSTVLRDNIPFDEAISFVDPGFLQMFDYPLLHGDPNTALDEKGSVILSREMALKYFDRENAVGKDLDLLLGDSLVHWQVTGVIDPKGNRSSLQFELLIPTEQYGLQSSNQNLMDSYRYGIVENYIEVEEGVSQDQLYENLNLAIAKYMDNEDNLVEIGIQPLTSIHLDNTIVGNASYTDPKKIYILLSLVVLVFFIALINYITLSTSHSLKRLREMGMRKTLGALSRQIWNQLFVESFLVVAISSVLAFLMAALWSPGFNRLLESQMQFQMGIWEVAVLVLLVIFIAFICSSLQKTSLLKYSSVEAMKGEAAIRTKNSIFNNSLVGFQFSLCILLIISSICIRSQMNYIHKKELGFDKERLLEINLASGSDGDQNKMLFQRFRNMAKNHPQVINVGASMNNSREPWTELVFLQDDETQENLFYNQIDPHYIQTMGIELIEGYGFDSTWSQSGSAILVNETLVQKFGWQNPLEEQIPGKNLKNDHRIIGVVKDFHFSSLHENIKPLILALALSPVDPGITGLSTYMWPSDYYQILVRVGPGELHPVINELQSIWNEINPTKAFDLHFVDESLEAKYADEKRWEKITRFSSIFALFIAWLGLLSLIRLSVQKRTKEIGIRKVLGLSTSGIIFLLARKYIWLLVLGNLIAWPAAWLILNRWLQSFSYRIELNVFVFLGAGLAVLLIVITSVGMQTFRTATSNPINALRAE